MTDSHVKISFSGPGYITKAVHTLAGDVQKIATSRRHRKGRGALLLTPEGINLKAPGSNIPGCVFGLLRV